MRKNYDRINLSKRLTMSLCMVEKTACIADVGCDHAHMDIRLLKDGIVEKCIAMDVRTGPLKKAEGNLKLYDCEDKVDLRLSDGLDALRPGEADQVMITGMGGIVMRGILERGLGEKGHLRDSKPVLILQPQSHIFEVREWLYSNGYEIVDEDICRECGKYYFAMEAVPVNLNPEMLYGAAGNAVSPDEADMQEKYSRQEMTGQKTDSRQEMSEQKTDLRQEDAGKETATLQTITKAELHFGPVLIKKDGPLFEQYLEDTFNKASRREAQAGISDNEEAKEKKAYFHEIIEMIAEIRAFKEDR